MKTNKRIRSLEILIPMILGDGWVRKKRNAYLEFCHNLAQEEYAKWKMALIKRHSVQNVIFGYKKHTPPQCYVRVHSHHKVNSAYRRTYENNKKVIKVEALKKMTELSLAIWYMDDGTTVKKYKTRTGKLKENPYITQVRFCTHSFSLEENIVIQEWLKERFGLDFRIYRDNREKATLYYLSCVGKENVQKFIGIVKPYIELCPSMLYKITI